ncbi:MAG: protein kinase, partial [Anaerolineales bacterium]|nr:protein kinase [Anaerolineales bacterium]
MEIDSHPVSISRRKTTALLAYIAVLNQPHSRDMLATLLWPEHDQTGARANLRRDLSRLKNALGDDALLVDRAQVSLNPDFDWWLDVAAFHACAEQIRQHNHFPQETCSDCLEACEQAVTLYTADFMAGFSLPDSPEFDEWQFFQADSLRRTLAEGLQHLIQWHTSQGEYERAIEYGRRWLALDTLHEPAHRALIRLYAWADQHAAALRQYEECVRILQDELGIEPEPETVELYEAVRMRQLVPPVPHAAPHPQPGAHPTDPPALPPALSSLATPHFEMGQLLAVGGHGELYRGRDRRTDASVVIKRLKPELVSRDLHFLARFQREAEILRQLNHPNIVHMLGMFEENGQHHIVMEYVPGGSLRHLLDSQPRLPLEQALSVALELADALSRAHHLGIIHRDIKP